MAEIIKFYMDSSSARIAEQACINCGQRSANDAPLGRQALLAYFDPGGAYADDSDEKQALARAMTDTCAGCFANGKPVEMRVGPRVGTIYSGQPYIVTNQQEREYGSTE